MERARGWKQREEAIVRGESAFGERALLLGSASPHYLQRNVSVQLADEDQGFFVPCPAEMAKRLYELTRDTAKPLRFKDEFAVASEGWLERSAATIGVPDLRERLLRHADRAAGEFLRRLQDNRYGHELFNGPQCAVRRVAMSSTHDGMRSNQEEAALALDFVPTDYFTNLTLRSLYYELVAEGHPIAGAAPDEILSRYLFFLSSFGIDILVILRAPKSEQRYVVFAKRRGTLPNMHGIGKWHVTMNEGLTNQDVDGGRLDVFGSVRRGLLEENGVDIAREERAPVDPRFYSLFFVRSEFEIGLCGSIELPYSCEEFQGMWKASRDGPLETESLYKCIPFTVADVTRFVNEQIRNDSITDAARFAAQVVVAQVLHRPLILEHPG